VLRAKGDGETDALDAGRGTEDVVARGGDEGTPIGRGPWDLAGPDAGGVGGAELLGGAPAGPELDVDMGTPLPVLRRNRGPLAPYNYRTT
jgi:hypothetical protein